MAPNKGVKRGLGLAEVLPNIPGIDGAVILKDHTKPGGLNWVPLGLVVAKTASYTFVNSDRSRTFVFNGSGLSALLPSVAPTNPWMLTIINENSTSLTVNFNGLNGNGSASNIILAQNQAGTAAIIAAVGAGDGHEQSRTLAVCGLADGNICRPRA